MVRSVKITTPIPTLEEFGKSLGLSKARQKSLVRIVMDKSDDRSVASRKTLSAGSLNGPYRDRYAARVATQNIL